MLSPASTNPPSTALPGTIGIDAGATLCKVAGWTRDGIQTAQFPAGNLERIREFTREWAPTRIVATGGGADALGSALGDLPVESELEFTAWARGAPVLAAEQGLELPPRYLLVSLGTGTSVLALTGDRFHRVGGTALGGGTFLGLGQLLLGTPSFAEISQLAQKGDRRRVDLLVGDIYSNPRFPLALDLNAASFGKLDSRAPADLAHSLAAMIGENIGLLCAEFARANQMDCVVFGGSTLSDNPALRRALSERGAGASLRTLFLEKGAFCGAVGAAFKHSPSSSDPREQGATAHL